HRSERPSPNSERTDKRQRVHAGLNVLFVTSYLLTEGRRDRGTEGQRERANSLRLSVSLSLRPSVPLSFLRPPVLSSDRTQAVISVKSRMAAMSIDSGESDVERFARCGEVYFESPVTIRHFKRLLQEPARRFADGRGLIVSEKAVAVELDEN